MEIDFPLKHNKVCCLILMGLKLLALEKILDSSQSNIWHTITICRLIDLLLLNSTGENRGKALLQLASKVKWNQISLVHTCVHTHTQTEFPPCLDRISWCREETPPFNYGRALENEALRRQFITMAAEKTTETVTGGWVEAPCVWHKGLPSCTFTCKNERNIKRDN